MYKILTLTELSTTILHIYEIYLPVNKYLVSTHIKQQCKIFTDDQGTLFYGLSYFYVGSFCFRYNDITKQEPKFPTTPDSLSLF